MLGFRSLQFDRIKTQARLVVTAPIASAIQIFDPETNPAVADGRTVLIDPFQRAGPMVSSRMAYSAQIRWTCKLSCDKYENHRCPRSCDKPAKWRRPRF
jgi:hypothetical protein